MKYPKQSLPYKPSSHIADKKYGFFQADKASFIDVASELGLLQTRSGDDISFARHPLTFLVEAADDICYTIIDFEDGINLGLISEEYALEYLIKLVPHINKSKYASLTEKAARVGYLRALAIGKLIDEAVTIFMNNEEAILQGNFAKALLDKSTYEAQINDIIKICVEKIYQSKEVVSKEIAGYQILNTLLEARCKALDTDPTHFDHLVEQLFGKIPIENPTRYQELLFICNQISVMTDSKSLRLFEQLTGFNVNG